MKELILLEGDQLEFDLSKIGFDLDKPSHSLCPECSCQIIELSSGCKACGWSQDKKLQGDNLSIPCEIKYPHQQSIDGLIIRDRGLELDVQIGDRVLPIAKLYVFPKLPARKKCRTTADLSPCKKSRRKRGEGSGYIEYREVKRGTKTYEQLYFHYEKWDKKRLINTSKYIPKRLKAKIIRMNNEKVPVEKILKFLNSKSRRKKK